ncbi:hypothetical protein ACFLYP_02115 [Chloroflexota bacterium]
MKRQPDKYPPGQLPVTNDLTFTYALSLVIAILMAAASAGSFVYRSLIYSTKELLVSFAPNDAVNLVVGLPILLGSMWLARRGKLLGLLLWPGALFYVLYNYIAYLFGMPFSGLFLFYLTLVTLSAYTTIGLVTSIDGEAVRQRLNGTVPEKAAGGIIAGLALLFTLRVIAVIATQDNQIPLSQVELSVLVADFVTAPAVFIGGVLLWQRRKLGYVAGAGLLFLYSMLFIGLIFFLILQPVLTTSPINVTDIIVVFIMGMVCFIPFGLFVRGVVSSQNISPE